MHDRAILETIERVDTSVQATVLRMKRKNVCAAREWVVRQTEARQRPGKRMDLEGSRLNPGSLE